MPIYKVNGDTYDIPANKQEAFEKKYPDASVSYLNGNDEYEIPLSKRDAFVNKYPEATLKSFSAPQQEVPMFDDAPNAYGKTAIQQEQPQQNENVETNFFRGLHQMNKNIWQAGLWHSLRGEFANLFTGSSREEHAALNDIEYLESVGIDPREYLANIEDAEFQKLYGMNRAQFDALDKSERRRLAKEAASKQGELSRDAVKALEKERKQRQAVIDAYQDALAEAGGDLDKAKDILRAKAEDKTWGDEQIEKADTIYAENKELQGAAKWGGLFASAIPSATALGLSFLTKGKTAGISRWLNKAAKLGGHAGMAGMSAGTAGMSMIEARQHGATNWQTWTTGIADGLIEFITEKIPFDKLTKPVLTAAKTRTTKALVEAMRKADSPGRKELEKLLTEANKKLGGKLLNGKNVADWLANAAAEGVSEATAEALQTVTSMIYLNPEEYPTFGNIVEAAIEGAKGGIALGGVLGGAGKAVEHSLHKDRRKQQGFVNVALVEQEGKNPFVAELVDYDPETKTYKALQDGEIVDVKEDEIQYKHQYTYNEFESGRYRQLEDEAIADGTVSDAQVAVSADRLGNARQKLENLMTEAGMTDEQKNATFADLEAGDIPGFAEDAKALWDAADEYTEAFKRNQDVQSAKDVRSENERTAVLDAMQQQMGGEFWLKGSTTMQENGMEIIEPDMVEVGTMQDGKQVYILSAPNEAGELSAITEDGKKLFIRNTDLQNGTQIMPLQEFLDARVTEQKKAAEQTRMAAEAAPQIDAIRQKYQMGTQVNLGTEESPTLGVVVGVKPENDGVFIQTESGIAPYTYDQLADIEGTPIRVMTDAQMAAAEAAEIEAAEAARQTELAETPEQMTEAETVVDNAVQMENLATETPLPLNSNGSVNQDALFKESPTRWAEWNDERKQDNGASSAQYIGTKLTKAQARLAELQTAYAVEDSLNKKELIEKAVVKQQNVVNELAGVMQKYAPQTAQQTEQQAPVQQERTTESVLASLNDGTLSDEEIRANIDANLAEAQKAYDKYAKKAPKMGTDKDAYLAEKQKYEQGLPALQQELDFWNGVKQAYESAIQQETIPTEESLRAELTEEDMEPRTPAELAARELGLKDQGIKLLWDSVKAHTGFGNGERQKFFGIFRSKDKGGMTIEAAGERLMEIDREYNLGLFDQNDPMAGVNAILDVLGDVQTIGDLRNYIANNREAQIAREAAAAYSAMNADFEAAPGMTMEEWAHANEVQRMEIMRNALSETEEYERNVKFAEEENQYGTDEYESETEAVSGTENGGNATDVEGGTDSLHRQGDSILQEAQSDNTGGEAVSAGQAEEDVSESGNQDGDTSVHAGEQATDVDGTPINIEDYDDLPPDTLLRSQADVDHAVNPLAMTHETMLKLMAETREAIHEEVAVWSDILGIKINVIDNYRDVQNEDAKANIKKGNKTFGWFEESTGEIFIYAPDYLNYRTETALKEVEKTILHEGIAHKGMREMLGEEGYGELCDKVWNEVMTEKQRKDFIKYPGVKGNTRAAADEFIASVSENVKQDTVWDKIANFFKDILNSIGIEIKVKDTDLKGLLKQSYQRYRKGEAKTNPTANKQAEGNTAFRTQTISDFAQKHEVSEELVSKFADSMARNRSQGAAMALVDIKRELRIKNSNLTFKEFAHVYSPIKRELFDLFGDYDALLEAEMQRTIEARNLMEAAEARAREAAEKEMQRLKEFEDMDDVALDEAYFAAMDAGDEARMRDIVNEAARRNGYEYTDFRMAHRAPTYDEAGINHSLVDVAKDTDGSRASAEELMRFNGDAALDETRKAIRKAFAAIDKGKTPKVKIYRAVPRGLKEGSIRNGDWVTLSPTYAKWHGLGSLHGDYQIMEATVPASDIYWDGNDLNEWGYDDKADYKYKDTANNRKLNDLVTRNDEGNVIPPSQRFNEEVSDVRFRTVSDINSQFNAELQQQIDGTLPQGHIYQLGMPSEILRSTGVPDLPIALQSSILNIKANDRLHPFDLNEIKGLVNAIQRPWAIFSYGDAKKAQNLIVGISKGDKQFLVGISLNPTVKGKTLNINSVRNVFPKDNDEWLNWIQEGKLLRVDEKEKIQAIIDALRINPVDYTHLDLDSIAKIVENFENPRTESNTRFRTANNNQAIFVSNAAKAVESIKQEKATPEQWLKMIEKNGGLKAGEDKWMGLSDWLKSSDKKTLTKQEVLDFINEHMIVIEEQHYTEDRNSLDGKRQEIQEALQGIFDEYVAESEEMNDDMFMSTHYNYAIEKLAEELGYQAWNAPFVNNNAIVELDFYDDDLETLDELSSKLGIEKYDGTRSINDIRRNYTTQGLRNLHEIALTVPTIESWDENDEVHFGDAGDGRAVAWIRFGETWERRPSPQISRKVLVIDEIQSKRHQEGREKGYRTPEDAEYLESLYAGKKIGEIPDAPFDKNWHELAMKRMLRYAAENGYDVVAWTKGKQQAERYDIGGVVSHIDYRMNEDGTYHVDTIGRGDYQIEGVPTTFNSEEDLAEVFGKEIAKKIVSNLAEDKRVIDESIKEKQELNKVPRSQIILDSPEYHARMAKYAEINSRIDAARKKQSLSDVELRIGGEGMKGFYDKMLPAFMNKYGKKWGVKVEDIELPNLEKAGRVMHSVPVTEEMKASVMEGQTMFRTTPISKEVQQEMDVISAQAIVNGNYLKAPNGADSKLTPEQWAMVRTKGFKEWFGDWENDPENASKVVDGNGEPMVVYHGTLNEFTVFNRGRHGIYFSPSKEHAKKFAGPKGYIGSYFLRILRPYVGSFRGAGVGTDISLDNRIYVDGGIFTKADTDRYAKSGTQEIVVFEPSQIKSATDNTGEFSESGDIRFRFIGEKGAANLDKAEEATIRLDNLAVARQMEEAGKDAKAIKLATGWERGKDNLWRYEVPDNIKFDKSRNVDFDKRHPEHVRYKELLHKRNMAILIGETPLTEDEQTEYDRLATIYRKSELHNSRKLKDYLDAPELFDAYPQLKDVELVFIEAEDEGNYDGTSKTITVGNKGNVQSVIIHEIQHAIQEIEGFAEGGNERTGDKLRKKAKAWSWKRRLEAKEKEYPELAGTLEIQKLVEQEYKDEDIEDWMPSEDIRTQGFNLYVRGYDNEGYESAYNQLDKIGIANKKSDMRTYSRLAGEVEARNVEARMDMSEEERRATLAAETEDVAREDQIILMDGLGVSAGLLGDFGEVYEQFRGKPKEAIAFLMEKKSGEAVGALNHKDIGEISIVYGNDKAGLKKIASKHPEVLDIMQDILDESEVVQQSDNRVKLESDRYFAVISKDYLGTPRAPWLLTTFEKKNSVPDNTMDTGETSKGSKQNDTATLQDTVSESKDSNNLANSNESEGKTFFRTTGTPTEQVVKDGLILSVEDFTTLAGNIFKALPEDVRRKVVENAARADYDLKKATFQMATSLAEKQNLSDEEIELAKMVAQKVEDAAIASGVEITRPFTTNEALWMLYQSTNPTSEYDLIGNARKAVVADNLGFSESQQAEQEKDADNIRFRSSRGAYANSAAGMYNSEQRSAWGMLRETYQDMYRSVKSLIQAIEKATGKVAQSWENVLMALNQLSSKNLADKKKYLRDFLTPMWDAVNTIVDKYHKSHEQIERYLMLKHGLERNKVLAARDAKNFYREQANKEIAAIKADKSLSKAEQKAKIQKIEDTYNNHVSDIEAGIDAKYREFRAKDYGGLTALFSDFADYGTRDDYESEEQYQAAALAARTPRYDNLADTENAAQQEVDAFEREVDKSLVDNLWKRINAATKETLRHQYSNNMLTKEQYDRVRTMFEYYVPLRGFVDTTAEDTYSYYVSGQQSKFANPLQGAKGRKTQAETPLGWIGAMAESAIQMDNKNTAKLALYYFAVNRPDNDILKISKTWYKWTGEYDADGKKIFEPVYPTYNGPLSGPAMQAQMDAFESMMEQQAAIGNAYKGKQSIDLKEAVIRAPKSAPEHIVTVKVAGEDYSIIINANPRAAQAINGMLNIDKGDNPLYRGARGLLRYLASIKTSLAPLFWITNFMRDVSFAFINTSIRNDLVYTKEFAKNYPQAFRVFSYVHKNKKAKLGDSKYEKYYTEFAENGGITGYTSLTNNTEYNEMMKAYANNARAGKFIRGMKAAFEVYQDLGESFEQVSRFAAYITAREAGKDITEAVNEAKEVTINFNRKGSGKAITFDEIKKMRRKNGKPLTKTEQIFFVTLGGLSPIARSFFMFFNAGMQGVRMIAKLAHEHPGKSAAWAGIVFTMGLVNAIIHALAEDDDEYLDMPDYVRRTNILIGKNGTYFKWSLPHEVRPFYAMADIFVQHAMGRKPNENIAAELAETFGEWLPINPFKDGMKAFTPDIARPFVEIKNNKDFTGSPIYREYRWLTEEQQKNMPAYEKGFDSTSKVLVDISEILNDISGGDQTEAGFVNINPAVVEHLAQEYGGGPLKLAEQFFKTIGVMTGEQEFSIRNTPFLSTFMVAADDRYRNAHTTELYKYYKGIADDVKRRAGEYKADKDKDGFNKLRTSDDFQIFSIYRKFEKRDKAYNEQLKRAKSDSERKDIMRLQDAHRKRMIEEISKL